MQTKRSSPEATAPRPSSTVVLVRPGEQAPEIFMVKRHERSSFGSAYAFPGGVLEDADRLVQDRCSGVSPAEANAMLQLAEGGLEYFAAAVRELFEESGVLLGTTRLGGAELAEVRTQLNDGSLTWDAFASDADLEMYCDRLHYFSFWITPEELPKRYSTRFFLAELPAGQVARHCGGELTDSCWRSADQTLLARSNKTISVHYPTRKTLERVAQFDSTSSLCEWARCCAEKGVVCDQPAFGPELLD